MDRAASSSSPNKCDQYDSSGQMPIQRDNVPDQQSSHQDESPATDPSLTEISTDFSERLPTYGGDPSNIPAQYTYPLHEQALYQGGFGGTSGPWGTIPFYNDKAPSLYYHPAYGYTSDVVFSPVVSPMSLEGQLYPHQIPYTSSDGTSYMVPLSSYFVKNEPNPIAPPSLATSGSHPMGILGPYDPSTIDYGYPASSSGGLVSTSYQGAYGEARHDSGSEIRRTTLRDSSMASNHERNRGPRASQVKPMGDNNDQAHANLPLHLYNSSDFKTDYNQARFFVIKSFSEDNVHRSIKYNVWSSTSHGNKRLDAAYREANNTPTNCPVFLFFSVNASSQFCGVCEMMGPVDFERSANHWQQDRWSGQFPVRWHIIKDVPNRCFNHLILESNDNKPVTHSRDCQEVDMVLGIEMLKIFKDFEANTSILDDFEYYDGRERQMKERKTRQNDDEIVGVDQVTDAFAQSLQLDDAHRDRANHTNDNKGE